MTEVLKHGKEYTHEWVMEKLSVKKLPDIPTAYGSYGEAYEILKEYFE